MKILLLRIDGRICFTIYGGFVFRQSFLQQLHVEVIVLGYLTLLALPYSIAYIALKAKPKCYHRVANAVCCEWPAEIEMWNVSAILPPDGGLKVDEQYPQNDGWQTDPFVCMPHILHPYVGAGSEK